MKIVKWNKEGEEEEIEIRIVDTVNIETTYQRNKHKWRVVTCDDCKIGFMEYFLERFREDPDSNEMPVAVCPKCKGHSIEALEEVRLVSKVPEEIYKLVGELYPIIMDLKLKVDEGGQ